MYWSRFRTAKSGCDRPPWRRNPSPHPAVERRPDRRRSARGLAWVAIAGLSSLAVSCGTTSPPAELPDDTATNTENASTFAIAGVSPRASGGFPSVVILTPEAEAELPVPEEPTLMDQFNTTFHPKVLIARVGQTVQFRNSEDTLHNVHVIDTETRETELNIATPVEGSFDHVFDGPGVFDVSCGIHPSMAAFIVVVETPFVAVTETDGSFELEGVPPGRYVARVWNLDRSRRSERTVDILPETTSLSLIESDDR